MQASPRARRLFSTLLIGLAAAWFAMIAFVAFLLGSLGMDLHWTASNAIAPHPLLQDLALLPIPALSLWFGLRLRRTTAH